MQKVEIRMQNENPSKRPYFCILTSAFLLLRSYFCVLTSAFLLLRSYFCILTSALLLHSDFLFLNSLCAIEQENRIGAFDHPISHFQMPLTKMCSRPLAPGTHKIVIQSRTNQRACARNYPP